MRRIPNRKPRNGKSSRRSFTRNAMKVHKKNWSTGIMRGGIRL